MVMGEAAQPVDFLVVGGGPGGYTAALRAVELGRDVTLIEPGPIGGTCLNLGCIPSKMLIESAGRQRSAELLVGDRVTIPPIDLGAWQLDKDEVVTMLGAGVAGELKAGEVQVIAGHARFTSRGRIIVTPVDDAASQFLEFRSAVIATGSRPRTLDILPIDGDRVIDSTGALALQQIPERLVVVGAGYIGIELATAFAKLGSKVTLVEAAPRILPELPSMFARLVDRRLDSLGVTRHVGRTVTGLTDTGVTCEFGGTALDLPADRVLVAIGRVPNTDDIGLDAARVRCEDGRILVGPDRVVPGTSIAAIGDVVDGPMLAHKASAEAVVAADALCGRKVAFDPATIPMVVFSDPEIASAGHHADSAKAAGIQARAVTVPLRANGRAATMHERDGFAQIVVDTDTDAVIGVHLMGPHASELIAEGVLAIELAAAPGDLADTIHAHPTLAEALHECARQFLVRSP